MKLSYFLLVTTVLSLSTPAWAMREEWDKNRSSKTPYINEWGHPKDDDKECFQKLTKTLESSLDDKSRGFSLYLLGICNQNGIGCELNLDKAKASYKKAIDFGNQHAMYNLAQMYRKGTGVDKDINQAITYFNKSLEEKDGDKGGENGTKGINLSTKLKNLSNWEKSKSMYALGHIYQYDTVQDIKKAITYYEMAIKLNNPKAMRKLAEIYWEGLNGAPDIKKAIKLYKKAAYLDDIKAILKVAPLYENGEIVEKYTERAICFYQRAVPLGDITAILKLAEIYEKGKIVEKDIKKAIDYYEMAVDSGDKHAILKLIEIYKNEKPMNLGAPFYFFKMAEICMNEKGVNKDINQAIEFYWEAANLQDKDAILKLIKMYENKEYVERDINKVIKLYVKAVNFNDRNAIFKLAEICKNGEGRRCTLWTGQKLGLFKLVFVPELC